MATLGVYEESIRVLDSMGAPVDRRNQMRFAPLQPNGVVQQVTLTGSAFTALSVPAGAKVMFCFFKAASAVNLVLKGITGDQGIPLLPATSPGPWDLRLPLNGTSVGFQNNGSTQVIELLFL